MTQKKFGFIDRLLGRVPTYTEQLDGAAARSLVSSIIIDPQWEKTGEPEIGGHTAEECAVVFESEPWVYACVTAIAEDISGLPIWIVRDNGDRISEPWQQEFSIFKRPNRFESFNELLYSFVVDYEITGDGYALWEGDELWWLPSWRTKAIPDRKRMIAGYEIDVNGKSIEISIDDPDVRVIHATRHGPRTVVNGMTPFAPLSDTIRKASYQVAYEKALWRHGARPAGLLSTDSQLTESQAKQQLNLFKAAYGGATNAGKSMLLSHGLKFQQMSMNVVDSGFHESRREQIAEILSVFHVPPSRVQLPNANYATAREEKAGYWQEKIIPTQQKIVDAFNRVIFEDTPYRLKLHTGAVRYIAYINQQLFDTAVRATGRPVASVNEARKVLLDLPPTDNPNDDLINPETLDQKYTRLARAAGWRQFISQNEIREQLGYGPHHDVEADGINKVPSPLFAALPDASEKIPNIDNLSDVADAQSQPQQTKKLNISNALVRNIFLRSIELRKSRADEQRVREENICIEQVSAPLVERIKEATLQALESARKLRSEEFRNTGILKRSIDVTLPDPSVFVDSLQLDLRDYLFGCFNRVGSEELENLIATKRSVGKSLGMQIRADVGVSFDINDPRLLEVIAQREQKIKDVPGNLLDVIRGIIEQGNIDGWDYKQFETAITAEFDNLTEWKAREIARTESGVGTSVAADEAMSQADVSEKIWIHSGNPDTFRASHVANSQQGAIPFNERFLNGMAFPMEPGAPPDETVNCQCVHAAIGFNEE